MVSAKMTLALALMVVLVMADHPNDDGATVKHTCRDSFVRFGPYCFHLDSTPRNWNQARKYCRSLKTQADKSDFVVLDSASKIDFVFSFIAFESGNLHYDIPVSQVENNFWVGGFRQLYKDQKQVELWHWIGKSLHSINATLVPEKSRVNFMQQDVEPYKDCLALDDKGAWGKHWCFDYLSTICESVPRRSR